jgi:hypothetical protein
MTPQRAMLVLVAWLLAVPAWAHKPSDSYLRISRDAGQLRVQWDIALKDLEYVVGLDADRDGEITWGELKAQREAIARHALDRLHISAGDQTCEPRLKQMKATRHSDGGYAVLVLDGELPAAAEELTVQYSLLFDVDPTHRGLVLYSDGAATSTCVLSVDAPSAVLRATDAALLPQFLAFVRTGVWHILIGFDHILFLATLLLPAVLERRGRGWSPVTHLRPTLKSVLKIVTVFTVAHSITLWLAVTGYVTLPSRFVEASIALSIVVTAMHNVYPVLPLPGWAIAFVFGLVHGFGFANVLLDLGLSNTSLGLALLGFNVGVELGQLAIVLVLLPLAFLARSTVFYRALVFRFGSVLIGVIGAVWMVERMFNLRIMGV